MSTTFKLTHAKNGITVEINDPHDGCETLVFQEPEDDEKTAWAGFLRTLTDMYGPGYNKYGKAEIHVSIRPGRKCELAEDVAWFLEDMSGRDPTKEDVERVATIIQEVLREP